MNRDCTRTAYLNHRPPRIDTWLLGQAFFLFWAGLFLYWAYRVALMRKVDRLQGNACCAGPNRFHSIVQHSDNVRMPQLEGQVCFSDAITTAEQAKDVVVDDLRGRERGAAAKIRND